MYVKDKYVLFWSTATVTSGLDPQQWILHSCKGIRNLHRPAPALRQVISHDMSSCSVPETFSTSISLLLNSTMLYIVILLWSILVIISEKGVFQFDFHHFMEYELGYNYTISETITRCHFTGRIKYLSVSMGNLPPKWRRHREVVS